MEIKAKNINPYLIDNDDQALSNRSKPICKVPEMVWGSKPNDDGNFLFTDEEKKDFIKKEPESQKYFRPLISTLEYLNGVNRWCLWLTDANPSDLRTLPEIKKRIENVRAFRKASKKKATVKLADMPYLFAELRQPTSDYIMIPLTTSENRKYVPFSYFSKNNIVNNSTSFIEHATPYHFGIITSVMHMAWMRAVCGRLEGRYRYSGSIVYNNFPWPESPSEAQKKKVEAAAKAVLDARKEFPDATLADLYDPNTMPKKLLDAHHKLDAAVDACYRKTPFKTELERLEYLFGMYKELTKTLFTEGKKKGKGKKPKVGRENS